jgi:hypothetical protein
MEEQVLIGFVDDTEFPVGRSQPDVFVFGGYFLALNSLGSLLDRIARVKGEYGLEPDDPVKWNLKDSSLKKAYEVRNKGELWNQLIKVSDDIRAELVGLLEEHEAIVMACALERLSEYTDQQDCYRWALENLLQRVGLVLKQEGSLSCPSVIVIMDWPQRKQDKGLFDIYAAGYHYGQAIDSAQDYFSGPLVHLGAFDSLLFGSTLHSVPLQVADITVGIIKDFLIWCYKGANEQKVRRFFPLIGGLFHQDDNGIIGGFGLKVSPSPEAFDIDERIREICESPYALVEPWESKEEIPF